MESRRLKERFSKTCTRLTLLRRRSEDSPRYLPEIWASEYNGILDAFDALGFEVGKFRILPREMQPFAAYTALAVGKTVGQPVTNGYHLSRDLLKERIDSALTHVARVGLPEARTS